MKPRAPLPDDTGQPGSQFSLPLFDPPANSPASPPATPRAPEPTLATLAPESAHRLFRHLRGNREVRLGTHLISYELKRGQRRSIGFVVGQEGLTVSAPRWIGQSDIDLALQGKARWILRKLADQKARLDRLETARVEWRDGTILPFLGADLRILLDPAVAGAACQELPRTLRVGLPSHAEAAQIRDAVQGWLQRQALTLFEERCRLYAMQLGVSIRRLRLSSAQTRWGSASADGTVRLNWRLIHFALPTIDYVVAHELAHLREMNHSPAFWEVVRSVMPDYELRRGSLKDGQVPIYG